MIIRALATLVCFSLVEAWKIWIDRDRDGIPDALEGGTSPFVVGIDDRSVDSDHDGMSNTAEFYAGTGPSDHGSVLAIESVTVLPDGLAQVRWQSVAGRSYVVEYSDDLSTWHTLGPTVLGDGSALNATDPTPVRLMPRRAYRVFLADF